MPNIGNMRTFVAIERRATTQDSAGEQSIEWTNVGYAWAEMVALTGRELEAAQAVRATDTHTFMIRYFPGLSEKDRLVYTTPEGEVDYYNITNIDDVEMKHRFMSMTAAHGLASG